MESGVTSTVTTSLKPTSIATKAVYLGLLVTFLVGGVAEGSDAPDDLPLRQTIKVGPEEQGASGNWTRVNGILTVRLNRLPKGPESIAGSVLAGRFAVYQFKITASSNGPQLQGRGSDGVWTKNLSHEKFAFEFSNVLQISMFRKGQRTEYPLVVRSTSLGNQIKIVSVGITSLKTMTTGKPPGDEPLLLFETPKVGWTKGKDTEIAILGQGFAECPEIEIVPMKGEIAVGSSECESSELGHALLVKVRPLQAGPSAITVKASNAGKTAAIAFETSVASNRRSRGPVLLVCISALVLLGLRLYRSKQ
jgi:hypothetical protein